MPRTSHKVTRKHRKASNEHNPVRNCIPTHTNPSDGYSKRDRRSAKRPACDNIAPAFTPDYSLASTTPSNREAQLDSYRPKDSTALRPWNSQLQNEADFYQSLVLKIETWEMDYSIVNNDTNETTRVSRELKHVQLNSEFVPVDDQDRTCTSNADMPSMRALSVPHTPSTTTFENGQPEANDTANQTQISRKRKLSELLNDEILCSLCATPWEISGPHRVSALHCGHVFGYCCLLSLAHTTGINCPDCKELSPLQEIRFLYPNRVIKISDPKERHALYAQLKHKRRRLIEEIELRKQVDEEETQLMLESAGSAQDVKDAKLIVVTLISAAVSVMQSIFLTLF